MVTSKTTYPDDLEEHERGVVFISLSIDCPFTDHDFMTKGMALSDEEVMRIQPKLSTRQKKIETGLGPQKEGWTLTLYQAKDVAAGAAIEFGIRLSLDWLMKRKDFFVSFTKDRRPSLWIQAYSDLRVGFSVPVEIMRLALDLGVTLEFGVDHDNSVSTKPKRKEDASL
jgi:hypothetical protein